MPRYTHPPPPPPPQKPQTRYSHPPPSTQPTRPANGPAKRYPTTETIIVDLADLARQKNALRQQSVNTVSYGRAPTAPSPPKKGGYDEWYGERRRAATMSAQALPVFACNEGLRICGTGRCFYHQPPIPTTTYAHPSAEEFVPHLSYRTAGPFVFPVQDPPPPFRPTVAPFPDYNNAQGYIPQHSNPSAYGPPLAARHAVRTRRYTNSAEIPYIGQQEESYAQRMERGRYTRQRSYTTNTRDLGQEERPVHIAGAGENGIDREMERSERMKVYEKVHEHLRRC